MTNRLGRKLFAAGVVVPALALGGCVWQSDYDALKTQYEQSQQQNQQLQQQLSASQAQVTRLQGAIKYTVNSDLLFPSGGYHMSDAGKQIISRFASKLAPSQQSKLIVTGFTDNAPIGPALARQGITSNQILSEKRAQDVVAFLVSQGVNPQWVEARGMGEQDPVASNATAAGRAQNRRVELTLGGPVS